MNIFWEKMEVGIVYPMIFPEVQNGKGPICESIKKILKDPFFGAVEISWIKNTDDKEKLSQLLNLSGITVIYGAGGPLSLMGLNLHSFNRNLRKKSVEEMKKFIDEAYFFNARIFEIIPSQDPGEKDRNKAKKFLIESLSELCEYAQKKASDYTISISIENFDRTVDKKLLLGPTKEAVDVVAKVKEKFNNVGLTIDLSHLPLIGETPEESLTAAAPYLLHVHIGNCILKDKSDPRYGDKHPPFGIKNGEIGVTEVARFLKTLQKIGYFNHGKATKKPVVSFEIKPANHESPEVLIAGSKRTLLRAVSLLDA